MAKARRHNSRVTDKTTIDRLNASLTVVNLAKVAGACAVIAGAVLGFISYFVTHKEFSTTTSWIKYDIRNNRLEYLNDKQYECDQKKMLGQLAIYDQVLCSHYDSQHTQVGAEVMDLKNKAAEAGK